MLIVISPAKRLNLATDDAVTSVPKFANKADELAAAAQKLSLADLKKLMGLSDNLAKLNYDRFRDFGEMESQTAAFTFAGDTYAGLEAATLDAEEMAWATGHLRILSGLYGLLRPLDAIQPYRLEMGSRLKTGRGKSLYEFWGDGLSHALNAQGEAVGTDVLVNCASQEYFGAVAPAALKLKIITPVFMEMRNGTPKIVSFYAKKARGSMARFIIQHRLNAAEAISGFDLGGYEFCPEMSQADRPVFLRGE